MAYETLRESGGYAGSNFLDRGYGIIIEAFMTAEHPDAKAAVLRLLREFVEARPELGEYAPERASTPVGYRHGGETTVVASYFVSAEGQAKWHEEAAEKAAARAARATA
jgi:hypothetical protein